MFKSIAFILLLSMPCSMAFSQNYNVMPYHGSYTDKIHTINMAFYTKDLLGTIRYSGPNVSADYYTYLRGSLPPYYTLSLLQILEVSFDYEDIPSAAYIELNNPSCPDYGKPCTYNHPKLTPAWSSIFQASLFFKQQGLITFLEPKTGYNYSTHVVLEGNIGLSQKFYQGIGYY